MGVGQAGAPTATTAGEGGARPGTGRRQAPQGERGASATRTTSCRAGVRDDARLGTAGTAPSTPYGNTSSPDGSARAAPFSSCRSSEIAS
jgi:hypothetical protein